MSESCVSQSISPLEEKVDAVEGQTVTLSCRYSGSVDYLYWYRQYPGSRPEFLLRIYSYNNDVLKADPPVPRLGVKLTGTKLDLEISSTAVSDSVLYYWHAPNEMTDGVLGDILRDLEQGITEHLDSPTWLDRPKYDVPKGVLLDLGGITFSTVSPEPATSVTCAQVKPALISKKHRAPVADLPNLVFCGKCQLSSTVLAKSCVSQSISPLEEKVDAVEGQTVTLSCRYEYSGTNAAYLHWYRQYPGSRPEFLLLKYERSTAVTHAVPRFPRLDVNNSNNVVNLEISSAAVSDSVLYYCALAPTVTGNPDTLYRNWFYD
ncbi:hypothetical protein NFI96_003000 [Prochilodus magdalenae]|nr:hypothetical protein NFI96_003000 [Prochilodus magdalenae]